MCFILSHFFFLLVGVKRCFFILFVRVFMCGYIFWDCFVLHKSFNWSSNITWYMTWTTTRRQSKRSRETTINMYVLSFFTIFFLSFCLTTLFCSLCFRVFFFDMFLYCFVWVYFITFCDRFTYNTWTNGYYLKSLQEKLQVSMKDLEKKNSSVCCLSYLSYVTWVLVWIKFSVWVDVSLSCYKIFFVAWCARVSTMFWWHVPNFYFVAWCARVSTTFWWHEWNFCFFFVAWCARVSTMFWWHVWNFYFFALCACVLVMLRWLVWNFCLAWYALFWSGIWEFSDLLVGVHCFEVVFEYFLTCWLVCTVLKWYLSIVTGTFSKVPIPSILYKICFIPVLKYPHQAYFIKFFRHMHKSTHTKHIYRISLVPVLKYPYKARFGSQFLRLVCVILNRYLKNFHEKMNFGEDVNIFRN